MKDDLRTTEKAGDGGWLMSLIARYGRASKSVRESQQRFEDIVNISSDWIWETDAQGRFTFVSPRVQTILGYLPEDLAGKAPWDFMLTEDAARVRAKFFELAESRLPFRGIDNSVLHKDGSMRYTQSAGTPLLGVGDRLLGYRGLGRDVTSAKIAEEQLRVSEERLRLALDATRDGLWGWNVRTGHVYRSPRYYEMSGYTAEEASHDFAFFQRLVHPEDLAAVLHCIETHRRTPSRPLEFDFRLITRIGEIRWMHARGRAVERDEAGVALRITGTLTDITEVKADEAIRLRQTAELARHNMELERFNRLTVGRELDMIALKRQVNELSRELGRAPPFPLAFLPET